jgi:hypothetical protein
MKMDSTTALILGAVAIFILAYYAIYITRSRAMVNKWAKDNNYTLLKKEHRIFRKGPYFLSGRNQAVYRVEVRDATGLKLKGWVRCGNWFGGVFGSAVESQMDETADPPGPYFAE